MSTRKDQVRRTVKKLLEYVTGGENMSVDPINSSNRNTTPAANTLKAYGFSNMGGTDKKGKYFKEVPTKGTKKKTKGKRKRKIIS